jgi:hypothetical protein
MAALLVLPLITGCKKQLFHLIGNINNSQVYDFNEPDGSFDDSSKWIYRQDIVGELNLPENARITGINITSLVVEIKRKPSNMANSATVSGWITVGTGSETPVFQNMVIPLTSPKTVISNLNNAGIALLKNQINNFVLTTNNFTDPIKVRIQGTATPAPLVVELTLKIKGQVLYDTCQEVPEQLFDGNECDF